MWGLCVTKAEAQPKSIKDGQEEQSHLSYDELCHSVNESQKQYAAARANHDAKNGSQVLDSAYKFGCTVVRRVSCTNCSQPHFATGPIPYRLSRAPRSGKCLG